MSKKVVYSTSEMEKVFNKVNVSEFKLIFVLVHYLAIKDKNVFINNAETRDYLASMGFKRTPVRVSTVLSSLARKKIIKKEGVGVYSIPESLFNIINEDAGQ